jgi:septal ring factor EnvC (AmiA/AmiB activator)
MDKELLAAIREELSPVRQDITRMGQDIARIEKNMLQMEQNISRMGQDITRMDQDITWLKVQMENEIPRQLNLLAEGQSIILERLPKPGKLEAIEDRVDILETAVTRHSADIAELKKAL